MNKIIWFQAVLVLTVFSTCSLNKMVVGDWQFEGLKTTEKVPDYLKSKHLDMLKKVADISYMKFYKDKSYEIKLNEGITKGNWKLYKKSNTLITSEKGYDKVDSLSIKELQVDKMVLSFVDTNGDTITMHLKRIPTD